jgi:hypothetical protein
VTATSCSRDGSKGTHLEGCGSSRAASASPARRTTPRSRASCAKSSTSPIEVGPLALSTTHHYPEKVVELHFYSARLLGEPTPQLGQEMRWVPRDELHRLPLPEADAALIALLQGRAHG